MFWPNSVVILFACLGSLACSDEALVRIRRYDFEKPVPSGLEMIPEARQLESLFGPAHHQIRNLDEKNMTAQWQTIVFVADRYELVMTVPVRLPQGFERVEAVLRTPRFEILEVSAITNDGLGARFDPQGSHHFDVGDWRKLYRAKGDFAVIDIKLKNQSVPDFDKYRSVMFRGRSAAAPAQHPAEVPTAVTMRVDSNAVHIGGGSSEFYPHGSLSILDVVEKPDVAVAVVFGARVRIEPESSGNGNDNTTWREQETAVDTGTSQSTKIGWSYSTRTQQLIFNSTTATVPFDRIAIVTVRPGGCDVQTLPKTDKNLDSLRVRLGAGEAGN